jgi:hypothetical protein
VLIAACTCPQEIIQGDPSFVDTVHKVLFEIDLDKRTKLSSEWRIVDIDNFLGGNDYLPELTEEPKE